MRFCMAAAGSFQARLIHGSPGFLEIHSFPQLARVIGHPVHQTNPECGVSHFVLCSWTRRQIPILQSQMGYFPLTSNCLQNLRSANRWPKVRIDQTELLLGTNPANPRFDQPARFMARATAPPISAGDWATSIPAASIAAIFSVAVPLPPEMMAPA